MQTLTDVEIASRLAELENRTKVSEHRLEDLENKTDKLESLTLSVERIGFSCETIAKEQVRMSAEREKDKAEQNDLAKRLLDVEQAPANNKAAKMDDIVKQITHCIISAVVSGMIVYLVK